MILRGGGKRAILEEVCVTPQCFMHKVHNYSSPGIFDVIGSLYGGCYKATTRKDLVSKPGGTFRELSEYVVGRVWT